MTFIPRHNLANRATTIQASPGFTMPRQTVSSSQPVAVAEVVNALPVNSAASLNLPQTVLNTGVMQSTNLGAATQLGAMTRSLNIAFNRMLRSTGC